VTLHDKVYDFFFLDFLSDLPQTELEHRSAAFCFWYVKDDGRSLKEKQSYAEGISFLLAQFLSMQQFLELI
jgi:hypothetical protein